MNIDSIALRSIKSFYVGGSRRVIEGLPVQKRQIVPGAPEREVNMNGTYTVGQMYVQEYRLAKPIFPYPVLLWHGGGMCGSQWESTPDGRDGWASVLLQQGFDVVVSDGPERGRSPWLMTDCTPDALPLFRSQEEAWSLFRIGPNHGYATERTERIAYRGQQFPHSAFDAFAKQFVPRWLSHNHLELQAYEALVSHVGPCVLIGHSQGGGYALQVAQHQPALVKAVVAIEPTGMPQTSHQSRAPHLAVWGDYFQHSPIWTAYRAEAEAYWHRLAQTGRADEIDLPACGIHGNSHFMMLDRNNRHVAGLVCEWLQQPQQQTLKP